MKLSEEELQGLVESSGMSREEAERMSPDDARETLKMLSWRPKQPKIEAPPKEEALPAPEVVPTAGDYAREIKELFGEKPPIEWNITQEERERRRREAGEVPEIETPTFINKPRAEQTEQPATEPLTEQETEKLRNFGASEASLEFAKSNPEEARRVISENEERLRKNIPDEIETPVIGRPKEIKLSDLTKAHKEALKENAAREKAKTKTGEAARKQRVEEIQESLAKERKAREEAEKAEKERKKEEEKAQKRAARQAQEPFKKTAKRYWEATKAAITGAKEGWLEKSTERRQVEKELKEMRAEERAWVGLGLRNLGFFADEMKNNFFAGTFGSIAEGMKGRSTERFWKTLGENFEKDAKKAREKIAKTKDEKTAKGQLANAGYLMKNVLKYGRTVADLTGMAIASPLRYVMMTGMGLARGAEVAKETRLSNQEVIGKTRIDDAEMAADIAWGIYENAERIAGDRPLTAKELQDVYRMSVPADLIERLKNQPGAGRKILQRIVRFDLTHGPHSVGKIESKLEDIDKNGDLSEEEKLKAKQKILDGFARHLDFLNRAVGAQGEVDLLAIGARYTETAAKAVVAGMMVETVAFSLKHLWDRIIPETFSDMNELAEAPETNIPEGAAAAVATAPAAPGLAEHLAQQDVTKINLPHEGGDSNIFSQFNPEGTDTTGTETAGAPETDTPEAPVKAAEAAGMPGEVPGEAAAGAEKPEPATAPEGTPSTGAGAAAAEAATPQETVAKVFENAAGAGAEEYVVTIEKGGSVWRAAEDQLEKHFGAAFSNLNEGQQTYIIDALKDKIVADPEKYGLIGITDPDSIPVGAKIDFAELLKDKEGMEGIFGRAGALTQAQVESIEDNNEVLREWVRAHPREQLSSEKINQILSGEAPEVEEAVKAAGAAGETAPVGGAAERAVDAAAAGEAATPAERGGELFTETEVQDIIPGRRAGEYIIPESGSLYNGIIRFGYDSRTGLPTRHVVEGTIFGFNPRNKLAENWFETMTEKLNISTENRGLTPQDDYLFSRVRNLEVVERIADKIPKNSPEGRYLVRAIGEIRREITERFGNVLKN